MADTTKTVIQKFTELVDIEKEYTLKELTSILSECFKDANKKLKKNKPPSQYNLFVKEKMPVLKEQFPEMTRQDLMKKVGELWKSTKTNNNAETEAVVEEAVVKETVDEEVKPVKKTKNKK